MLPFVIFITTLVFVYVKANSNEICKEIHIFAFLETMTTQPVIHCRGP